MTAVELVAAVLTNDPRAPASNRGLLASTTAPEGEPDLRERRRAFAAEVRGVVERVVAIDETDATNRQESAGVRP